MPTLTCDRPNAIEQVEYYTIAGLPGDPTAPLSDDPNYGIKYDVSGLPTGAYSIRVSACNKWSCSLPSPLDFTGWFRYILYLILEWLKLKRK